jgi:hypothetical protein
MKNAVFWDVERYGLIINRHFGETYTHHINEDGTLRIQEIPGSNLDGNALFYA